MDPYLLGQRAYAQKLCHSYLIFSAPLSVPSLAEASLQLSSVQGIAFTYHIMKDTATCGAVT